MRWVVLALGLTGCPAIVDVPACFTVRDCADGLTCQAGECVPDPRPDRDLDQSVDAEVLDGMPLDKSITDMRPDRAPDMMPASDMAQPIDMPDMASDPPDMPDAQIPDAEIPADDTLDPALDTAPTCLDGCDCSEPMRLPLLGDARIDIAYLNAPDAFWLAVSHANGGQVEHGIWAPGCAVDWVDQGAGQQILMPPAIEGDGNSAGLVWRNGVTTRFARRQSNGACGFDGATHDLLNTAVGGVDVVVDAGLFHIAANPDAHLNLLWHDGVEGDSTQTEADASAPRLARSQLEATREPWWAIWTNAAGRILAQGFDADRSVGTATSLGQGRGFWHAVDLAPLSDREFYITGLKDGPDGLLLGAERLSTGGFLMVDPLQVRVGQNATALSMAREGGRIFGVTVDYRRADRDQVGFVRLNDGDAESFPIAYGRHAAIAYGGGRFGVAWIEPGTGAAFMTVSCR